MSTAPLPPERLRWRCDPAQLGFETTADVEPIEGVVGQEAAVEALAFGLEIDAPGQNVFVRGLVGSGRLTLVKNHLAGMANGRKQAPDYVFVHNFDAPDRPRLLTFARGRGRAFCDAIDKLITFIEKDLITHVNDEALAERHAELSAQAEQELGQVSDPLEAKLKEAGLSLTFETNADGSHSPALLPRLGGEEVTPQQIAQAMELGIVTKEELEELGAKAETFAEDLERFTAHASAVGARLKDNLRDAVREVARQAVQQVTQPLGTHFPAAEEHLQALTHDLLERRLGSLSEPAFTRLYAANLITLPDSDPAPAIVENSPSVQTLLGSIDTAVMPDGSAHAPHMGLHAGAFVHANGGVLILDARDLANAPGAWSALIRTLRSGEVELTPDADGTTQRQPGLKPASIPVDVKVVLLGEAGVYHALDSADPEFPHLFKVLVDFEDVIRRDAKGLSDVSGVLARIVRDEGLPPLTCDAVAELIEHGARIAARPDVITARFGRIVDIAREAVWVARRDGKDKVCGPEVAQAIRRTKQRAGVPGRLFRERVSNGILKIRVDGQQVGQINGLATTQAGQLTYGFPSRITATVGPGSQGTINIEGMAALSGAIHTKAFFIIGGCLRSLLRTPHPLSFDASVAFEQSYGGIDGDSASGAEVCCLISALTNLPLKQSMAMTGAIDQHGNILPVGAVNEKIEGFYDTCKHLGLTGEQGCLLPASNVGDLMLRADVVEACAKGTFHVWPVEHVRDALALLTGLEAGVPDERGEYAPGTVMARAMEAARALWEQGGRT